MNATRYVDSPQSSRSSPRGLRDVACILFTSGTTPCFGSRIHRGTSDVLHLCLHPVVAAPHAFKLSHGVPHHSAAPPGLLTLCPFAQAYGESLAAVLEQVIGDLASVAMISLFKPMHYLIQLFGGDAVKLLVQPLTKLLHLLLSGEVLRACAALIACPV